MKDSSILTNEKLEKLFLATSVRDKIAREVVVNTLVHRFTKIYSGTEPILEEGDVFKTTVLLDDVQKKKNREVDGEINGDTFTENTETSQKIIKTVEKNCGENPNTVEKTPTLWRSFFLLCSKILLLHNDS